MADLSLYLRVFIASPSEVKAEREAAKEVVLGVAREAAKRRLLLDPFLWEYDHPATSGPPQPPLTEQLRHSEKVVFIFWKRVGKGTREELNTALPQAHRGETDNVAIYFKTGPAKSNGTPKLREQALLRPRSPGQDPVTTNATTDEVRELRDDLIKGDRALSRDFASTDEFRRLFDQHLRLWLARWDGVPACCQYALENAVPMRGTDHVGETRLTRLERSFDLHALDRVRDYLASEAVKSYQRHGSGALGYSLNRKTLQECDPDWQSAALTAEKIHQQMGQQAAQIGLPFVSPAPLLTTGDGGVHFADAEWFAYFCAVGLACAIRDGCLDAIALRPYPNEIHQFLSALVERERLRITQTLIRWLTNADGSTSALPVARDFAAYVLGMIGAVEAQDALAETMSRDKSADVVMYCITSLGKLRARRYLPQLVRMFQHESNQVRRLLLSEAVSNMVGITRFDL